MSFLPENAPAVPPPAENPAEDSPALSPRRIPNLGHALLFVSFAALLLFLFQLIFFALGKSPVANHAGAVAIQHPKLRASSFPWPGSVRSSMACAGTGQSRAARRANSSPSAFSSAS
jgi:hypothetical protein